MVTLWNDIRLAYGRPPLGFINPFLYQLQAQTPTAFRDVVTGNNVRGRVVAMSCHVMSCHTVLKFTAFIFIHVLCLSVGLSVYLSIYLSM